MFYATPLFWIALIAILLFSVELDWLPSFGYETVGANYKGFAHVLDVGAHLIMPAMTHRAVLHGDLYPHDPRLDAGGRSGSISSRPPAPRASPTP